MYDPRAFAFGYILPAGDDAVSVRPRDAWAPAILLDNRCDFFGIAVIVILSEQFIERSFVLPAEERFAFDFANDLEAFLSRFFFEELFDRFQVVPSSQSRLDFRAVKPLGSSESSPLDSMRFCLNTPFAT